MQVREKRWVKIVRREAELCYDGSKFKVQALKSNKFKFCPTHSKKNPDSEYTIFWIKKVNAYMIFLTCGKEKIDVLGKNYKDYSL